MSKQIVSTSSITGKEVKNPKGREIGEIEDFMINPANGDVLYAVLSFGGIMGLGSEYYSVPVEALTISDDENVITMDVNKERLEHAPSFDRDDWPITTRPEYVNSIYTHYGYTPKDFSTFR